jgi:hypothetical protein
MKHSLLMTAVFVALAIAACRDDQPAPRPPIAVDGSGDGPRDGGGAIPGPDGKAADDAGDQVDGGGVDVSAADVSATEAGLDVEPDTERDRPDAGMTCGQSAREMLCLTYCDGVGRFCSGGNTQYRNADACRSLCNAPIWSCGKAGDGTGNSLFCRMTHTALAGVGGANQIAAECRNAGPESPSCQ